MRRSVARFTPKILVVSVISAALASGGCFGGADGMEALTAEDVPTETGTTQASPASGPPAPSPALTAPAPAEEAPIAKFVGTYKWVGGAEEQRKLWGKIEGMANTFNFIAKPIVRDKLAEGNQIHKELRIEADQKTLVVHSGKTAATAPLDGSKGAKIRATNGEVMDLTFEVKDAEIVQTMKGIGKERVNRYELQGDRLIVHTRIRADQLPYELVYQLTYERVAGGDAGVDDAAKSAEAK